MLNERLKEDRLRLEWTQPRLAEIAKAAKRTVIDWEKGLSSPTALQLEAMAQAGLDVLYVVTGVRANASTSTHSGGGQGNVATSQHLIDADRLLRIVDLLESSAANAGRKWPANKLTAIAAEVYNVLADEPALDEPKVERILRLVVNR